METATKLWLLQRFALIGAVVIGVYLHLLRNIETIAPFEWWLPFVLLTACGIPFAVGMRGLSARVSIYVQMIGSESLSEAESRWAEQFAVRARNEIHAFLLLWTIAISVSLWIGLHGC